MKAFHDTIVNEMIPKGLITCQFPMLLQPVTILVEVAVIQDILKQMLRDNSLVVYEYVTVPKYVNDDIAFINYSHEDILNGNFEITLR